MKKLLFIITILILGLTSETLKAQSGWIQTELNAGLGRSLYATDTEIFAATYNGVYSTIDNGMPWFSKGLTDHNVSDVIESNQYILAATLDGVYRSSDGGDTWVLTNGSPGVSAGGGIYGPHVFAKNSAYVFIIAWGRGIFRSDDDGENWEQVWLGQDDYGDQDYASGAIFIYTVGERIFMDATEPLSSGYRNVLWSSSDNGNSWGYTQHPSDSGSVQSLCYDNGKLFACGDMGVYLSTDLGNSWSTQYSNTIGEHGELIGIGTFRNIVSYNQNLIAAVDFNSIYISSDDGESWTSFNDGLISDWTFTGLAIKPPYIWALRESFGNAYRRLLTEVVTGVDENKNLPIQFSLSQNYPNPFNPVTTISYQLPKSNFVKLSIYNITGQLIETLVNGHNNAGYHTVLWNASEVGSGLYFYRIEAGEYTETKKCLILK